MKEISTIIAYHEVGCEVPLLIPALHLEGIEWTLDISFWIFIEPDVLGLAGRELEWVWIHVHDHGLHVDYCWVVKLIGLSLHKLGVLDWEGDLLSYLRCSLLWNCLLLSSLLLLWRILSLLI